MSSGSVSGTYEPNAVVQAAYRRFFEHIDIDDAWLAIVREAARQGPVVYVMRNLSFLDFMALDYITKHHRLPQLQFANDLGLWVLEPFAKTWSEALLRSERPDPAERLADVIASGGSAGLFLKRPPTLLEKARRGRRRVSAEGDTLVRALFDLQQRLDRPIMLVPQVFVWSKRPDALEPSAVDFIFGQREWPGRLRLGMQFLLNYRNVLLRAGEPISLREFVQANAGESPDTLVRRATYAMLRKVERERRAILGPVRKPADRMRDEVIRSPRLQNTIRQMAGEGSTERLLISARAYRMLRTLEAAPDMEAVLALSTALKGVLNVMYAGVDVDREGLERLRQASQTATIVLLPSHKSHMDYLLLSHILHRHALQLPLIAAGDNLSFFPLGALLRRGGAFFIRRRFSGDRLYAAVVDAYLRRIMRDGWPIEVFLEGTRSRTGKLLAPKLGLLSMIVESGLSVTHRDVCFVPVSIGYERLIEEGSYVRELLGAEKTKEDATGLLRASRVLAERYGRLNVQFGEFLSLRQVAGESGWTNGSPSPALRRDLTKRIAYRTMSRINAVTAATPGAMVALALLSHERRGVTHARLVSRVGRLLHVLRRKGARMTSSLVTPGGQLRIPCVREATEMYLKARLIEVHYPGESFRHALGETRKQTYGEDEIIYSVPENRRLALDLSKNIILHFFVPNALISAAMLVAPGPPVPLDTVRARVQRLSVLFKQEFTFTAGSTFEELFDSAAREMIEANEILVRAGTGVEFGEGHSGVDGRGWVELYAAMIRNFFEAYLVAARGLSLLLRGPMTLRELVRRTLALGDKMYLAGEIERREALSGRWLENAFQSFLDQGYLHKPEEKRLALVSSFSDATAVRAIEARIASYVPTHASDPA